MTAGVVPRGTPCAVTREEYREALRKQKVPSTTEYVAPGAPGSGSHPDKAMNARLAALETARDNDREEMNERITAAEERAMVAEKSADKYRKKVKKAVKAAKAKKSSRKRTTEWGDETGEESESSDDDSSSSDESDSE